MHEHGIETCAGCLPCRVHLHGWGRRRHLMAERACEGEGVPGGGVLVEVLPMHEQVRPQGQGVHGGDGPTLLGAMRPGGIVSAAWCDAPHTERGCSGWNSGRGGGEGGGARLVRMLAKRARPKIMMTMDTQTSDIEDGVMSP